MKKLVSFIVAICLYLSLYYFVMERSIQSELDFTVYRTYAKVIFSGWLQTIAISLSAVILALLVGLVLYLMHESRYLVLRYLAEIHKTIIFGTPLLVIAIVSYYYIGYAFGLDSKFWIGVITLALYIGAYIADIYKGAIESIHMNQWQAAKMFGFSKFQTYRYIIFPQVVMSILPPLAGQFALTIKGSALLSYMGTSEFLNSANTVMAVSFAYPEGFIIIAVGYLIITVPIIRLIRHLEDRLNYKV
jgi:polar amino acid transport system permease protein